MYCCKSRGVSSGGMINKVVLDIHGLLILMDTINSSCTEQLHLAKGMVCKLATSFRLHELNSSADGSNFMLPDGYVLKTLSAFITVH